MIFHSVLEKMVMLSVQSAMMQMTFSLHPKRKYVGQTFIVGKMNLLLDTFSIQKKRQENQVDIAIASQRIFTWELQK